MFVAASLLYAFVASATLPPAPAITLCGKPQPPVLSASLTVTIEVFGADDTGTPPNPRFAGIDVQYGIDATTLDPDAQGEDGGLEPTLGSFELLRPDGHYVLPWDIPPDTKLVDEADAWEAWLGNDNDGIGSNALEFADIARDRVRVRWSGNTGDCAFLLEGELPIGEVRVSAPADADVMAALAAAFGSDAIARTNVKVDELEDQWTKTKRLVAIVTPK